MAVYKKTIFGRVSLASGQFAAIWSNIGFDSFTKELNSGLGECVVTLDVNFDYDENDLAVGNDIELWISDCDTTDGVGETDGFNARMVFKGYTSLIERDASGTTESVKVHILGYNTLLAIDILKNGSQTTLYSNTSAGLTVTSGSQGAADIGLMMRAVIDRFRAETSTKIWYRDSVYDVPNTGNTASYTFEQKTYRQALDYLKSLAPANVYWYIDELGKLTFGAKPSTNTHTFVFGKHFSKVHVEHSIETVRNVLMLWDGNSGGTYKHYEDATSIALYGRRAQPANDYGIAASGAADAIGAKFLAENKSVNVKVTATIIDNNGQEGAGYDIESIQPGNTCKFVGFSSSLSTVFQDAMLITKVTYFLDRVDIEVQIQKSGLIDFAQIQATQLAAINSGGLGIPVSYT